MNMLNEDVTFYDLKEAVRNKEFIMYYQPQINIKTMKVCSVEALLRWKSKKFGAILPPYFISMLEETEKIKEVGKFVLEEACNELNMLENLKYNNLSMAVNISGKQLEDESFLNFVENVVKDKKVRTDYLSFELTERILISPTKPIVQSFNGIRNLGIKIYIDDYGIKNSSLDYLRQFAFDGIKIDKSFVSGITNSQKEFIIAKNIVDLANELDIDSIAEGVEKEEQVKYLKSIGCKKVQGFFFARPMDSKNLLKFLKNFEERG